MIRKVWALAFAVTVPGSGAAMPLEEAVRLAAMRDPVVAAFQQDVAQQETNIEIIKDGQRPRFGVHMERTRAVGSDNTLATERNIGLELVATQMLFDWGKVSAQIEGATYDRVGLVSDVKNQLERVTFNISSLYMDVATAKARLQATAEYQKNAVRLSQMTNERVMGGLGDVSETSRAKLEISRSKERQVAFESDREVALEQLGLLVGVPGMSADTVPELAYGRRVDASTSLDESIKLAPDYIKAHSAMDSAQAGIDVAKASNKPALSFEAIGHPGMSGGGPTSGSVGLVVGVDLGMSDLFGRQALAAEQKYEGSRKRLAGIERDLKNQTLMYIKQIRTLAASEAALKIQVDEARTVVSTYEEQFTAGLRGMTDIFTSIQELYSTQLNLITTADQRVRTEYKAAQILGMLGTLLEEKTGAPVPDIVPAIVPPRAVAASDQAVMPNQPETSWSPASQSRVLSFERQEVMP
jgi:adhesin transport system outer membrane protein